MSSAKKKCALLVCGLIWAGEGLAEGRLDYSGLLAPQIAGVHSKFTLAPLSITPFPQWDNPEAVGRFYGRFDVRPSYDTSVGRFGFHFGLYSNVNTAYDHRRGVVPFDRSLYSLQLTRLRPEAPIDFDRFHLFQESAYGRLELGWVSGVSERTAVTAPLNWGVGSVGGDYPYFVDKPLDIGFVTLSAYGSGNTSPRIAYFTPAIYGVEVGLSYQPDTRNTGLDFVYGGKALGLIGRRSNADVDLHHNGRALGVRTSPLRPVNGSFEGHTAGFTDVFEAGLRSEQRFGNWRLAASVAGIVGSAVRSPLATPFNDLMSVQAGFQVGYGGWTLGGGAVFAGESGYSKDAHWRQRLNQYSIHGGLQYEHDRWTFGVAALNADDAGDPTERSDRQLWVYSAGLRYRLNPDLDIGAEVNRILPLSADFGDYEVYMGIVQLRYRFGGSVR